MADFSTILQTPQIRAIVQENILERMFHDALFPRLLFRGEATPVLFPGHVGDSMVFTGRGLIKPKTGPLVPGTDPVPSDYQREQWTATMQLYADSIDTNILTSISAIVDLFLANAAQMGLSAGQSLNRVIRNRLYAAGLSGNTVTTTANAGPASTALPVARLNGFTKARNPNLAGGSPVQFAPVSSANPLAITVGAATAAVVIGFTPAAPGDEVGPGTLTLQAGITWANRDRVVAADASAIQRVGGGATIDALTTANILTFADIRSVVSRFRQNNVDPQPDKRYHLHLSPNAEAELSADVEFRQLNTALPDYYMYRDFAIGEILGCLIYRNSECPIADTVSGGPTASYDPQDAFAGELFVGGVPTGAPVYHTLLVGQGAIYEYYQDLDALVTEAGITGRIGQAKVTNNGVEINVDRVQLVLRSPLDRLQHLVPVSYQFVGDWPTRTDATTGSAARFKRIGVIEHA